MKLLALLAIILVAGCIGQNAAKTPSSPADKAAGAEVSSSEVISITTPTVSAKWDFAYCGCGLHQLGDPMAETECYNLRWQCIDSDKDPDADPCILYKEITDLYQEGNCSPNWSNPEAVNLYCAWILPGTDLCGNPDLAEICDAKMPTNCTSANKVNIQECINMALSQALATRQYTQLDEQACLQNAEQYAWGNWSWQDGYCFRCELFV